MSGTVALAWTLFETSLTVQDAYERFKQRRLATLREVWFEEIAEGGSTLQAASEDDAIEIVVRLRQATVLGAARTNLRLLARILRGLSEGRPLYASDFARFQRMVGDLTREEIVVIATLHRERSNNPWGVIEDAWKRAVGSLVPAYFETEAHMRAWAYSAQRSGLLMMENNLDAMGYLTPTPLMDELAKIAALDESLWNERVGQ